MAKNNMLLGYARGKVGDLVFQRRKGEQITKARNRNPNNPRTWAQQMQRVRMYAPVAFYKKAVENFYRFAFENKKPNETDYNAFIRENLNAFQGPYFTRSQVQQKYPALAPYIISSGNLSGVEVTNLSINGNAIQIQFVIPGATVTSLDTVQKLSQSLIANLGMQNGDMLTAVEIDVTNISVASGNVSYSGVTSFRYKQFIVDIADTRELSEVYPDTFEPISNNAMAFIFENVVNTNDAVGASIIVTRRSNGKISASTARMTLNTVAQNYFTAMSTTQQLLIAAQSYDAQYSALDPKATSANNVATSRTGSRNGESQENIAFGCLPNSGGKTTEGIPPYTLDNECPTCGCPAGEPEPQPCEPDPCGCVQETSSTRRSTRKPTSSSATE